MQSEFKYDIALSFAGAQRAAAEGVAAMLKRADVRVFYDFDEAPALWGKDLSEELARVYGKEARYCLMFVSEAYRDRMWTRHERKIALARAISQSAEYILPVRFDSTQLDGIPHTIGYVSFESDEQIAALVLAKLGLGDSVVKAVRTCELSSRLFITRRDEHLEATIPVAAASWSDQAIKFELRPDDPSDAEFLNNLRSAHEPIPIAYKHNVGIARRFQVTHETRQGCDLWHIEARLEEVDFAVAMEITLGDLTPDRQAELRAGRILLNSGPRKLTNDLNQNMEELYISGQAYGFGVLNSPFPHLFRVYSSSPDRFLESAWITAVFQLKATGTVKDVQHLKLTLQDGQLGVDFLGRRHKHYSNLPATEVRCTGRCPLIS